MKKVLSITAIAMAATTGVFAKMSHTMYAGLGLGHVRHHHKVNWQTQGGAAGVTVSDDTSNTGEKFGGMLLAGYRMGLMSDKMFVGVELDLQNGYSNKENSDPSNKANGNTDAMKIKVSWAMGGSLLLGYHLNKNAYVALRAGLESRTFKVYPQLGSGNFGATISAAKQSGLVKFKQTSFVPGVLVGMPINDCWEAAFDYRYVAGEKKAKGVNTTTDIRFTSAPNSSSYLFRATYKIMSK